MIVLGAEQRVNAQCPCIQIIQINGFAMGHIQRYPYEFLLCNSWIYSSFKKIMAEVPGFPLNRQIFDLIPLSVNEFCNEPPRM